MQERSDGIRLAAALGILILALPGPGGGRAFSGEPTGWRTPVEKALAERGRAALLLEGFLKPEWSEAAYANAGKLWEGAIPDPKKDPAGYEIGRAHV